MKSLEGKPGHRIEFDPLGKAATSPDGESIMDAARRVGLDITSICGGKGTCHRCKVHVESGQVSPATADEAHVLSPRELAEGYRLAYRVAADSLRLGIDVAADSCNPIESTRREWEDVATGVGAQYVNIEVVCSDRQEHRVRVVSSACFKINRPGAL